MSALHKIETTSTPQRDVTLIYPYYDNPEFLAKQALHWITLPDELKARVSVVVVDDGSPKKPADEAIDWQTLKRGMNGNVQLFRIDVNVRWNWLAARNIGAHRAKTDWMLMTDMDHVVPVTTLRGVIYGELDQEVIYRFSRVGTKTTPHPNSWLYTKMMFWGRIGGYDEDASGFYGTDGDYRRRCAEAAPVRILELPLEHHEYEGDSSTKTYLRKQPEDANGKAILRAKAARRLPPKVLSFPYHEVSI